MTLKILSILLVEILMSSCDVLPTVSVWLKKVDFEVDPKANNGEAFVCHIVIAYSKDLLDRLQGMDSQGYFSSVAVMEKTYKDSIEIFRYDMIPGKNKIGQNVKPRSYIKAKGAFLFAKYLTPGKFMENIGRSHRLVVRFLPYKMETHDNVGLEELSKKLGT